MECPFSFLRIKASGSTGGFSCFRTVTEYGVYHCLEILEPRKGRRVLGDGLFNRTDGKTVRTNGFPETARTTGRFRRLGGAGGGRDPSGRSMRPGGRGESFLAGFSRGRARRAADTSLTD